MNLEKTAVITLDTDWVPESIMESVVSSILPDSLPVTFFITGEYPCLLNSTSNRFEFAPHTNPAKLDDDELVRELDNKIEFCEKKPTGHRGHSLYWTERMRPLFRQRGIRYDSSTMMYLEHAIRPFRLGYDLLEIPLFFMDFFHFEYCGFSGINPFDLKKLDLERDGLKVFDFHPIHLYINTPNLEYYSSVKQYYQKPEILAKLIFDGYGTRNLFTDILYKLHNYGYTFTTLETICTAYFDKAGKN